MRKILVSYLFLALGVSPLLRADEPPSEVKEKESSENSKTTGDEPKNYDFTRYNDEMVFFKPVKKNPINQKYQVVSDPGLYKRLEDLLTELLEGNSPKELLVNESAEILYKGEIVNAEFQRLKENKHEPFPDEVQIELRARLSKQALLKLEKAGSSKTPPSSSDLSNNSPKSDTNEKKAEEKEVPTEENKQTSVVSSPLTPATDSALLEKWPAEFNGKKVTWRPAVYSSKTARFETIQGTSDYGRASQWLTHIIGGKDVAELGVTEEGDIVYQQEIIGIKFIYFDSFQKEQTFPITQQIAWMGILKRKAKATLTQKVPKPAVSKTTTPKRQEGVYKPSSPYLPPKRDAYGNLITEPSANNPFVYKPSGGTGSSAQIKGMKPEGATPIVPKQEVTETPKVEVPPAKFEELVNPIISRPEVRPPQPRPEDHWKDANSFILEKLPRFSTVLTILEKSDSGFFDRIKAEIQRTRVYMTVLDRPYQGGISVKKPELITELISNQQQVIHILHGDFWRMPADKQAYTFLYAIMLGLLPGDNLDSRQKRSLDFVMKVLRHEEKNGTNGIDSAVFIKLKSDLVSKSNRTLELERLCDELTILKDQLRSKFSKGELAAQSVDDISFLIASAAEQAKSSYEEDYTEVHGRNGAISPSQRAQLEAHFLSQVRTMLKKVKEGNISATQFEDKIKFIRSLSEAIFNDELDEQESKELIALLQRSKDRKSQATDPSQTKGNGAP